MTDDLLEALQAVEEYRIKRKEFEDKFLINGYLCITPEQYRALRAMGDAKVDLLDPFPAPPQVDSIQVLVIRPGEQRDLGAGWVVVNNHGTVYGFKTQNTEGVLENPHHARITM